LWRYSYGYADVPFDEANNLARTAGVELIDELVNGSQPLAARAPKQTIRLLDYEARGEDPDLGAGGTRLIDVLHGLLWRLAHRPAEVSDFLAAGHPDADRLRIVTQALQGRALRDEGESKHPEAQRCERLLGSWRTVIVQNLMSSAP
jgi:putative DNA methylase